MIYVVLVEPEHEGNLGAVARVMANFGFSKLLVINPKIDVLGQEARNREKHAQAILKKAKKITWKELSTFDYVIGTTGKLGTDYNLKRTPISPEELAVTLKGKRSGKVALVIGRESKGLLNTELAKCDFVVSVPASKKYSVLNISHAVGIILYELYKVAGKDKSTSQFTLASRTEKQQILKMINTVLNKLSFQTPTKKETQKTLWKRLVGKAFLTKREAYALMGFFKKLK